MLWNVGIFTRGIPRPTKAQHLPVTFGPALPLHWQLQGQEVSQTPGAVATCGYFNLVFCTEIMAWTPFENAEIMALLGFPWLSTCCQCRWHWDFSNLELDPS
jgi:hypothetical protein